MSRTGEWNPSCVLPHSMVVFGKTYFLSLTNRHEESHHVWIKFNKIITGSFCFLYFEYFCTSLCNPVSKEHLLEKETWCSTLEVMFFLLKILRLTILRASNERDESWRNLELECPSESPDKKTSNLREIYSTKSFCL